jgi:transposase InsO family protein
MRIWDRHQRLLARIERGCNRLYTLRLDVDRPLSLAARADDNAWKWHKRFGHINFNALRQLVKKQMVHGLPAIEHTDQFCDTCVLTKQKRMLFPAHAKFRAEHALDLVHGDICGPVTPATPSGKKYFLLLVDDYSRFMWLLLLAAKSDAPAAIKRFQAAAELESGRKLKILRTDYGGEFTSLEFGDYRAAKGVQRHHSAPYLPQQNGVVERRNQTVVATARSMLKQRSMPAKFWGEAVSTAVFLLNRAPTKALNGRTPYEAWYDKKPAVSFLRTFGCLAFMKKTRPHQSKLEDRSTAVVFIGYEAGTKAYRVFDPVSQRVHITRDVVFDEKRGWDWSKVEEAADGEWRTQDSPSSQPPWCTMLLNLLLQHHQQQHHRLQLMGVQSKQLTHHHQRHLQHLLQIKLRWSSPHHHPMLKTSLMQSTVTRLCASAAWTMSSAMTCHCPAWRSVSWLKASCTWFQHWNLHPL